MSVITLHPIHVMGFEKLAMQGVPTFGGVSFLLCLSLPLHYCETGRKGSFGWAQRRAEKNRRVESGLEGQTKMGQEESSEDYAE